MDVLEAITMRRSVRQFSDEPISDEILHRLKQAIRFAPSACNSQPWHFVLVTDPQLRKAIAAASKQQMWMADAPLTVVAVGLPDIAYPRMGGKYSSVEIDISIALDHLTLTAVSEGLGTCWIGAFDENAIMELLHIPEHYRVIAMIPVGYPASDELICEVAEDNRKPEHEIFSDEYFVK